MSKIIVWDLFGGDNCSVRKSLDDSIYEIYTFDIKNGYDLSNDISYLDSFPKPDIITASPPCESWSIADCAGRIWNNDLTLKDENYYYEYNKNCQPNKKRCYLKKVKSAELAIKLIVNTTFIINKYKPKYWYIENPQSSLIWKYIKVNNLILGFDNIAWYGTYDLSFSKKPTNFLSNINLNLRKEKVEWSKDYVLYNTYTKRSAIPSNLLKDIFEKIKERIDNE